MPKNTSSGAYAMAPLTSLKEDITFFESLWIIMCIKATLNNKLIWFEYYSQNSKQRLTMVKKAKLEWSVWNAKISAEETHLLLILCISRAKWSYKY